MKWAIKDHGERRAARKLHMSRKNQFIGVGSRALFSVRGTTWGEGRGGDGRKEETVWKCKRTVKIQMHMWTKTRVDAVG